MKTHHPWWPHLDRDPIFNPFVSVVERRPTSDRIELSDTEEDQGDEREVEHAGNPSPADK
jgi:hypothetical protein